MNTGSLASRENCWRDKLSAKIGETSVYAFRRTCLSLLSAAGASVIVAVRDFIIGRSNCASILPRQHA